MLELMASTGGIPMRKNSLKPINRKAGRAEFFSVRNEVEAKILQSHSLIWIYAKYVN